MRSFVENLLKNTTAIFLPNDHKEIVKELENTTYERHIQSTEVLKRSLEEVTSKFRVVEAYTSKEEVDGEEVKYIFTEVGLEISSEIQRSFINNKGVLHLVSSDIKSDINKQFVHAPRYKQRFSIHQAPDFVYLINGEEYWVNLDVIRDEEEEKSHSRFLELLYFTLYEANRIYIDVDFEEYGKTADEGWYKLIYFRLSRNSLFIVVKDTEMNRVFHHNFEHIRAINYNDIGDRYKFWLYMVQGPYRFYLPSTKENVNNSELPIDPKIYQI